MSKRTVEVELQQTQLDALGNVVRAPLVVAERGGALATQASLAEPGLESDHMLINIG
ncbi:MAG: hypothetical protein H7Z40_09570, partial [Phycisphaerae bacterium]|nr:hypothetical protein [Gemmatimonadaceae bacterium]